MFIRMRWGVALCSVLLCAIVARAAVVCAEVQGQDQPKTTITLEVETPTATLFNGLIAVSPCAPDASSTVAATGYCAVMQSGLSNSWSSYGDDQFLNEIGGVTNDYAQNQYWSWFADLAYGETSLNKHVLKDGEHLLVTLGRQPLKLVLATTTLEVESTTTISLFGFGFDSSWNGVWLPISGTITIASASVQTDQNGSIDFFIASTTPSTVLVKGVKDGYIDSPVVVLSPQLRASDASAQTDAANQQNANQNTSSGAGSQGGYSTGGSDGSVARDLDSARMFSFLASRQQADGSFGGSLYTDWAAIAYGAGSGAARQQLASYLRSSTPALTSATDYERHAMALMALGIDPYSGTPVDYIHKIIGFFDGTQIGDPALANDDIFAVFPLMRAGYDSSDPILQKIRAFIVSRQSDNGSWNDSVDLTAAAVQALAALGDSSSASRAKAFIRSRQNADGGFGSSFATSWAIQARAALGDSVDLWTKAGKSPEQFLGGLVQTDGGVEAIDKDMGARVWATAYAIPAALHRMWLDLLQSFSQQSPAQREIVAATTTPSTLSTSTPLVLGAATSSVIMPYASTSTANLYKISQESLPRSGAIRQVKTVQARESTQSIGSQEGAIKMGIAEMNLKANRDQEAAAVGMGNVPFWASILAGTVVLATFGFSILQRKK